MRGPSLRGMKKYAAGRLGLKPYLRDCGDGRQKGRKPARDLIWAMLAGHLVRETSFHSIEVLVRSPARRNAGVGASFAEDTLSYFTERMDEEPTRQALIHLLRLAKRNKVFQDSAFIGLALDGTTVGRCHDSACGWCRPYRNAEKEVMGYRHHVTMISVVGTGLSLPFDVEPYGPKDSEYAAGQRLLRRSVAALGVRFADYVVVDAEYNSSTFLHSCHEVGLPVLARLKGNLHELSAAVEKRFRQQPPHRVTTDGEDRIELWDADDFDPWETLQWPTVRVIRYRQHHADGTVIEADWLTNMPKRKVASFSLYRMAKSRWEIENEGFNDCKSRQGFEHICHHLPQSLLVCWLLMLLALVIGRLYRLRHLHRGNHPSPTAIELVRALRLRLGPGPSSDSS